MTKHGQWKIQKYSSAATHRAIKWRQFVYHVIAIKHMHENILAHFQQEMA